MFDTPLAILAQIALRTGFVYVALLLGLRATGKRQIGQLTPFDLVVLLLVSNAVQNAMTGPDNSVSGGLVAAATLLIVNYTVSHFTVRSKRFRDFVDGQPVPLVICGVIQEQTLRREQMTVEELEAALREHEVSDLEEVELAMLEVDGSISVIRHKPEHDETQLTRSRKRLVRHHMRHDV
jgi:uncharacterized membrane protein YcaP (DUF421 family)